MSSHLAGYATALLQIYCQLFPQGFGRCYQNTTSETPQQPEKWISLSLDGFFLSPKKHKGPKESQMDTSWWLNHAGKGKSKKRLKPPPRTNLKDDFCKGSEAQHLEGWMIDSYDSICWHPPLSPGSQQELGGSVQKDDK